MRKENDMKMMMASMSFEKQPFGYSVHAEEDKMFVLRREYDEYTGEVTDMVGPFDCGTTISEIKKLFGYLESIGVVIERNNSTMYDPNITTVAHLDDGELILNETSNTVSFVLNELFVQFGLDEEPETPPELPADARLMNAIFGEGTYDPSKIPDINGMSDEEYYGYEQ